MLKRSPANPIITPEMVKPSRRDFQIDGTFNAGVIQFRDQVIMLLRVAESAIGCDPDEVIVPTLELGTGGWSL